MHQVSRPLLIVLVVAVAFLGLWLVALKPHGSSSSAPAAQTAAPAHPAATPAAPPPRPAAKPHAPAAVAHSARTSSAAHAAQRTLPARHPVGAKPIAASRVSAVEQALARGKVLALLFYNPSAADDQAVRQELAAMPPFGGQVFKLAIPLAELSNYTELTSQVPVNISPTLVIIDRARSAQEIVGFADGFEIAQRLQDAVSVRAGAP